MKTTFSKLHRRLLEAYGTQNWWPAKGAFEMMLGAILIQHTAWPNASRAIDNLRAAGLLSPEPLHRAGIERVAELIRPAGVFNVKARRVKAFVDWYRSNGGSRALRVCATPKLRRALLTVKGIGPETADDILVYAFGRPVFVVDAYARRLFGRYGLAAGNESYTELQSMVEREMPSEAELLGEFHALIVEHGKRVCRTKPLCDGCCLRDACGRRIVSDK